MGYRGKCWAMQFHLFDRASAKWTDGMIGPYRGRAKMEREFRRFEDGLGEGVLMLCRPVEVPESFATSINDEL